MVMHCHHCGSEIRILGKVSRAETCPKCDEDVHCCLNCEHYDTSAHNRCREPQAEWVTDREKANFCDFFTASRKVASRVADSDLAKKAFDNLFKK